MATNLKVCDLSPEAVEKTKAFRFRKNKTTAAITFKIKDYVVVLDEEYEDVTIEELQEELPASQPRYIVISYCHSHQDGRISYPLIFVFVSPSGCKPELQMMYAGTKLSFLNTTGITKDFEIRNVEELTEEYIKQKVDFFR